MKEICHTDNCTGCRLCAAICPKNCIDFTVTIAGHHYPVINEDLCINCNKCVSACVANQDAIEKYSASYGCYAAWCKDSGEHYESASAGLATALSRQVIRNGGKVYGCAWNNKLEAVHIGVENEEGLEKLRKSKYTSSRIPREIFEDIKRQVSNGRTCLFIGVGCQCDAVRRYFHGGHNNLVIVDLLCRGGASPLLLDRHIAYLCAKHKLKGVNNVTFRGGDYDCRIALRHNADVLFSGNQFEDEYFLAFMSHIIFRKSCYNCNYADTKRVGDITLADFWGLNDKLVREHNLLKQGVNLVLVNTEKGRKLFDSISSDIDFMERELSEAVNGNDTFREPTPMPERYNVFWEYMDHVDFEEAMHRVFKPEYKKIAKNRMKRTVLSPLVCLRHHFIDKIK